jgi:hypothetical protein
MVGQESRAWQNVGVEKVVQAYMEVTNSEAIVGRSCMLLRPVRDRAGLMRFNEKPRILREVNNLNRRMFLVQFSDGSTTFLFPDEINIE